MYETLGNVFLEEEEGVENHGEMNRLKINMDRWWFMVTRLLMKYSMYPSEVTTITGDMKGAKLQQLWKADGQVM